MGVGKFVRNEWEGLVASLRHAACSTLNVMRGIRDRSFYHFEMNAKAVLMAVVPLLVSAGTLVLVVAGLLAFDIKTAVALFGGLIACILALIFQINAEIKPSGDPKYGGLSRLKVPSGRIVTLGSHHFIVDDAANALLATARNPLIRIDTDYSLPQAARGVTFAVAWKRVKYRDRNEPKIRLATNINVETLAGGLPIQVQKTWYFHGLMTNELFGLTVSRRDALTPGRDRKIHHFDPDPLFFDGRELRSPATSGASNHIGGSTIAITKDGKIVFHRQSQFNQVESSKIAPSGSGSFDWADYEQHPSQTLQDLIVRGIERELREELTVATGPGHSETVLTGFYRLLGRGGKLEFCAVTYLDQYANGIRHNPADCGYTREVEGPYDLETSDRRGQLSRIRQMEAAMRARQDVSYAMKISLHLLIAHLERQTATADGPDGRTRQ